MKSFFLPKVATRVTLRQRKAKAEVRLTAFQAALRLLKRRMARSEFGWGCDEAHHASLDGADVFRAAMCQAVHEALWTVAHAGVEEEPLTASLMGGLTSCLSWYALIARLDQDEADEPRHCNVYWAHQPRHVERWRGADFGIARRLTNEDFLRITLYQAKVARPGTKVDLYRRLREDKVEAANIRLRALLRLEPGASLPPEDLHQIHKLYKTRNRGLVKISLDREAYGNPEWVRYFFRFASKDGKGPSAAPSVRSVTSLLEEMSGKL
ncbi:hypothetical protein [Methylobacterium sp. 1030]|uniref:hypothetical protein n=1 Tax=Methylobacterium sp. 1030 TaxID=3156404 RepID=UPI00339B18D3